MQPIPHQNFLMILPCSTSCDMTKVKIVGEAEEIKVEGNRKGEMILKQLGFSPTSTIILKNGKPIPEDVTIGDDDYITIIKSFSGG